MRKLALFSIVVAALSGGVCWAVSDEIDTDLMQAVEEVNDSLSNSIALKNKVESLSNAKEIGEMFVEVERFYSAKPDAEEALKLSRKSIQLAVEITGMVERDDFDAAALSATDLSRTCKTCHNFYKKS